MRKELVVYALNMAVYRQRPKAVVHHSDHGPQYTSIAFRKRCSETGITMSMGSVGDCYDTRCAKASTPLSSASFSCKPIQDAARGIACDLRLHQGLELSASASLSTRLPSAEQLRTPNEQSGVVSNQNNSTKPSQHQTDLCTAARHALD